MYCKACDKYCSGIDNFKQHEASEKHKRKMQHYHSMSTQSSNAVASSNENINPNRFFCSTCTVTFQTFPQFAEHSQSEEHANMILLKKSTEVNNLHPCSKPSFTGNASPVRDCDSTSVELSENVTKGSSNVMPLWSRCIKCDKNFSGPEPYQQHIESLAHKKKSGLSPAKEILVELPTSLTYSSYTCEACNVKCTGQEPYQQHIVSERHKKKVLAYSNSAGVVSKENLNGVIKCEKCNMTFSGPFNFEQHLMSEGHKKKVEQLYHINQIANKENSTVGSVATASSEIPIVTASKAEINYASLAWFCKICEVPCSGVDNYKQHMAGKAHAKKVMKVEAKYKQNQLQNMFAGKTSSLESYSQTVKQDDPNTEVDGKSKYFNSKPQDLGLEIKTSLFGESSDFKTITPSSLDLTFFAVGEKIDFNKNLKTKIEAMDLDKIDVDEDESMD